ncbi:MAG: dCTP deaminase [Phycisphaerales bacterium]|nr:dCTP deaminase [Phycisphaerales bacterium]
MILSNTSIHEALRQGWLVIDPRPLPEQPGTDGAKCPYQTSAVDLRLGDEILCFSRLPVSIDLRDGGFSALVPAISERWTFPREQPFTIQPNQFILGQTLETVTLPLLPDELNYPCLAARIEGRSSYSRCGLLIHFTAPTIHAGFSGTIALEICNFGPHSIQLFKHSYICQLIIEQVHGRPFRNDSQFQGQTFPGGSPRT